jgi:hypothetical protein
MFWTIRYRGQQIVAPMVPVSVDGSVITFPNGVQVDLDHTSVTGGTPAATCRSTAMCMVTAMHLAACKLATVTTRRTLSEVAPLAWLDAPMRRARRDPELSTLAVDGSG